MPGAPNRPPETAAAAPPPAPPAAEPPLVKLRRKLVPAHVALLQESWKGPVPPEVLAPFDKATAAARAGEVGAASSALELLSIRLAEPRWPTLAEPYRRLRVPIPAPVPPHWDPDHGVEAAEKEARRARRAAEDQLLLAEASLGWAAAHAIAVDGLDASLGRAKAALAGPGLPPGFYPEIDRIWEALEPKLPSPARAAKPAPPPVAGA